MSEHPLEGRDCPYCDGTLTQIKDWENPLQCTGQDCPATFVAVIGGKPA